MRTRAHLPPLRLLPFLHSLARRPTPSGGALLPALDALRGVAVLAVFAQHLGDSHLPFVRERIAAHVPAALAPWLLTVLHHAHWGVDLFFVLSGFSLAQPLLARLARARALTPTAPVDPDPLASSPWRASFLRRRVARIYPAYLAALALVVVAVPSLARHPAFPASALAHLTLLQGYVAPGGLALIGAAWSLTTEASFYLVWPFLAPHLLAPPTTAPAAPAAPTAPTTTPRSPLRPYLFGLILVVLVWLIRGALHELALLPTAPPWLLEASQRRWAISRLDQFVLGALAASLHARLALPVPRATLSPSSPPAALVSLSLLPVAPAPHARLARLAPALLAFSALALTGAFYLEGSFFPRPFGSWPYALVSLATTSLVLAAVLTPNPVAKWLFPKPLRAVGVISYGVFLHHQLALGATARLAGPPGTWTALGRHSALALALSLLLGWLSWILIERPVIEWAARRERARAKAPSSAAA